MFVRLLLRNFGYLFVHDSTCTSLKDWVGGLYFNYFSFLKIDIKFLNFCIFIDPKLDSSTDSFCTVTL